MAHFCDPLFCDPTPLKSGFAIPPRADSAVTAASSGIPGAVGLVGVAVAETASQSIHQVELPRLDGKLESLSAYSGKVLLAVNVASRCGFTPQYAGLQALQDRYADQGLVVAGFPCNQFFRQEPGTADQIQEFCSLNYGVTFPLFSKLDVKGATQHPLYAILSQSADDSGKAGNVSWNFEKFLIGRDGRVVRRFRSKVVPEDPRIVDAIEALL
jgi:glutathione peroxidase